ncbi:MAG: long-chain fatty acid--CoA ligase [Myxococcota bacterium]
MSRDELDQAVQIWIREGAEGPLDEPRFEALALALFAYQHEHNAPYRRLCETVGIDDPRRVECWQDIPAVPTGAFKEARLACFPPDRRLRVFRTSGSTTERRGELHLDTLDLYEASLRSTFGQYVLGGPSRMRILVLAPPAEEAPDSSLSHMFHIACRDLGTAASRFYVRGHGWDPDALIGDLAEVDESVALVGTAFAFVHLLDELEARGLRLTLPVGSRAMETGGFKGRSRELSREELHGGIAKALGLPRHAIVNQYGMCELASQFYEPSLLLGHVTTVKRVPPWVRTRVVDAATLQDRPRGEPGVLVHYDLANTGSVLAVQTSDLGRRRDDGFEILGRLPGAEQRGCSIAADALLALR